MIFVVVVFGVGCSDCDPEQRAERQQKIARRRDSDVGGGSGRRRSARQARVDADGQGTKGATKMAGKDGR